MSVLRNVMIVLLMLIVRTLLNPTSVNAVTTLSMKVQIQVVPVVSAVLLSLMNAELENTIAIKMLNAMTFLKDSPVNVVQSSLINLPTESLIRVDSVFLDQLHLQMSAELMTANLVRLN